MELSDNRAKTRPSSARASRRLTLLGGLLVVLGGAAILLPVLATLAGEVLIGWMLALWGVLGLWFSWEMRPTHIWRYGAVGSLALLGFGIASAFFRAAEIETLTFLVMLALLAEGAISIIFGVRARRRVSRRMTRPPIQPPSGFPSQRSQSWRWLIFSGACSLLIGAIILVDWPGSEAWALGLLIGVNFLSTGVALIMLAVR